MLDPKPSLWSPFRRLLGLNCSWCVLSTKLYSQRSICSRINIVDCQFRVITKMFGNFWTNVVILVNFWSFNPLHVQVAQALIWQKFRQLTDTDTVDYLKYCTVLYSYCSSQAPATQRSIKVCMLFFISYIITWPDSSTTQKVRHFRKLRCSFM